MQDLNQSLKDVLYMVSNIIEKDSNRNYGDRDKYLHKLHITWNDFINNHPESLSLLDLVLKDSIYFKADITLDMNLNPWKYSTHCNNNTVYMYYLNAWYYFNLSSKQWLISSINSKFILKTFLSHPNNLSKTNNNLRILLSKH